MSQPASSPSAPQRAPKAPAEIEQRAQALLSQLTMEEKIGMMSGSYDFWPGLAMIIAGYGAQTWDAGGVPRLGIEGMKFTDGPRGVIMAHATTFPVAMARGATFDPALEEQVGDVIGREIRAEGGNFFGGVCVNLVRHPAWGRAQESYGEDPIHLGIMGAAVARGVQRHAMACVKHFAANSIENARFHVDVKMSPRPMHEIYLRHFRYIVINGIASVMSAYNQVNGSYCGENVDLLQRILKDEWGFDGYVITDFIFGMRSAKKGALAGQDIEMPFRNLFQRSLPDLVKSGEVPEERINDAVLRQLRTQLQFERDPADYPKDVLGAPEHRALARKVAEKSIVLLKNDNVLPLKDVKRIAVLGRLAAIANTGDTGSSNTKPDYVVTPLQGLQEALKGRAEVIHNDGADLDKAASIAKEADVAIVVVGYTGQEEGEWLAPDMDPSVTAIFPPAKPEEMKYMEALKAGEGSLTGGGDRDSLRLLPAHEELIQRVAAANPKTIVAIMAGSAVITEAWREKVPGIVMLWYPGMEGGRAFADILLGNVNPSGRLPLVMPKRAEDLPLFDKNIREITYDLWHGYRKLERDGAAPAFPFGFGLSYTTFEYTSIDASYDVNRGFLGVTVGVRNTGAMDGDEVVQIYASVPNSKVERAAKELKGFQRVTLRAGEAKQAHIQIPADDLAYYDEAQAAFVVEPGEYKIIAARHSLDPQALSTIVRL